MKRPIDFAIVGVHKSATTSLYHFLRQHVDIYLPEIEENRFFTKPEFYAEGDRFLDPLYQGHRNSQRLGMKNVHIMFFRSSVDLATQTLTSVSADRRPSKSDRARLFGILVCPL